MSTINLSPGKKRLFKAIILVATVGLLIVGYYAIYWHDLRNLGSYSYIRGGYFEVPAFPYVSDSLLVQLGWAHTEGDNDFSPTDQCPTSSYIHAQPQKPDSVFRIGMFGGSYTEGYEAGPGYDFPSFLQREFRQAGYGNVEVINFGVSSYGVHQSYLLFKALHDTFQLDYAIVNPYLWHYERDNTFVTYNQYGPLHARFIPSNGQLELKAVLGDSRIEALKQYRSFLQPSYYWRYDIRPPNFMKPLPIGMNPFYYREGIITDHDRQQEVLETYELIFRNLEEQVEGLCIITHDEAVRQTAKSSLDEAGTAGAITLHEQLLSQSVMRAPMGHYSPLGNAFIAKELFANLTGHVDSIPVFTLQWPEGKQEMTQVNDHSLTKVDSLHFEVNGHPVGKLFHQKKSDNSKIWRGHFADFQRKADELLLLGNSLEKLYFVPMQSLPASDSDLQLAIERDGKSKNIRIGTLQKVNPYISKIVLKDTIFNGEGWQLRIPGEFDNILEEPVFFSKQGGGVKPVRWKVGDNPLPGQWSAKWQHPIAGGTVYYDQRKGWQQHWARVEKGQLLTLRIPYGQFVAMDSSLNGASYDLVGIKDGKTIRYPFLSCRIDSVAVRSEEETSKQFLRLMKQR